MSESASQYERIPCRICGGELDREQGTVCRTCLGFNGSSNVHLIPDEATTMSTCQDCGALFEPFKNGRGMQGKICLPCMTAKRVATTRARWASQEGGKRKVWKRKPEATVEAIKAIPDTPMPQFDIMASLKRRVNGNCIMLDFTPAPEVLAWLKKHHDDIQGYLMALICEDIPGSIFKLWMLDRLIGGQDGNRP